MAVHLRADETGMEVQGLAPLGQYIMNGQNRQMTWGFTTAYTDLGDLFVMVPGPNNTALTPTYVYNGQEKTYVQRREVIAISNPAAPGGFVTVPITVLEAPEYGPVLNTIFGLPASAPIVAYRSATLRNMDDNATTQSPYEFFTRMYNARSFDDAKTAASMYTGGGLNIGMTHTNGDIGYLLLSGLPQRKRGHTGMFPVIGNGSWDWKSVAPAAKTVFAVNPSKNYLFNGNSHIVPYGFPGQVGVDHPVDTRAGRIDALIKAQLAGDGTVSIADMKAIQQDVMAGIWDNTISGVSMKSILGSADVATLLASSANLPEYEALMAWDGISRIGDQVTVIFEVFIRRIRTLSQGLGLGANGIRDFTIVSLINSNDAVCTTAPRFVTGNPAFTNCAQFVAAAFDAAVNTIKSKHAGAIPRWSVDGRVGKQVMANPLLSDPTGQSLTATTILPHAGGTQSINVGGNFVESGPWGFMYKTYGSVVRYIAVHDSVSGS
jgi:penicillin amidase